MMEWSLQERTLKNSKYVFMQADRSCCNRKFIFTLNNHEAPYYVADAPQYIVEYLFSLCRKGSWND